MSKITGSKINDWAVTHELKTWPALFTAINMGIKNFEVRENDRQFKVGDILQLKEYNPNDMTYTGAECTREISFILHGGQFGIKKGYVVMGLQNYF